MDRDRDRRSWRPLDPTWAQRQTLRRLRAAYPDRQLKLGGRGSGSGLVAVLGKRIDPRRCPHLDKDGYHVAYLDGAWRRVASPHDPPQTTLIGDPPRV